MAGGAKDLRAFLGALLGWSWLVKPVFDVEKPWEWKVLLYCCSNYLYKVIGFNVSWKCSSM